MDMSEIVELGDKVRDKVTGFIGIVTARIEYLYDCLQYQVTPPYSKKGEQKVKWIDAPQLVILKKNVIKRKKSTASAAPSGGIRDHP